MLSLTPTTAALGNAILTANKIEPAYSAPILLLIALTAVLALLFLIMKLKMHAFVALVLVSLLTALATKIPFGKVVPTLLDGFGTTLASVAQRRLEAADRARRRALRRQEDQGAEWFAWFGGTE